MAKTKITAYKGFNRDMTCRDFKYEENGEYTHQGEINVCNSGCHAVKIRLTYSNITTQEHLCTIK